MPDEEVAQFIEQESFLNYCFSRNDRDIRYWQQWLEKNPQHAIQVESMRQLVLLMAAESRTREIRQDYAELQNRISSIKNKEVPAKHLWPRITTAAAAILIFLTVGIYVNHQKAPRSFTVNKPGIFKNDATPGNKAILTLSNGKQLILASILPGKINNTSIRKKEDGTLAYTSSNSAPDIFNTLTVPKGGGIHKLKLADGTLVVLDAGSSVRFPVAFNGKERRVSITGQVYFEVFHDPSKPFFVNVKGQTIEDIGTHFNINSFDGNVVATLLEGSVKVGKLILKPGQQAIQKDGGRIYLSDSADKEAVVAWKNGLFKFDHTDLNGVMAQLSRWYDVDVIYEGPVKMYQFGGYLPRNSKLTSILKILQLNGVKFSLDGRKLSVYR